MQFQLQQKNFLILHNFFVDYIDYLCSYWLVRVPLSSQKSSREKEQGRKTFGIKTMHSYGISSAILCELSYIPCEEKEQKWKRRNVD